MRKIDKIPKIQQLIINKLRIDYPTSKRTVTGSNPVRRAIFENKGPHVIAPKFLISSHARLFYLLEQ